MSKQGSEVEGRRLYEGTKTEIGPTSWGSLLTSLRSIGVKEGEGRVHPDSGPVRTPLGSDRPTPGPL